MTQQCPCGSQNSYQNCCEKVHLSHAAATTPEMLMRARYSANVLGLVDFIIDTYHPTKNAQQHREAITDSANTQWLGLEIIDTAAEPQNKGMVEFKAFYFEAGAKACLHERSNFVRENALWYYLDGSFAQQKAKVGRNDFCPCNSGKKFKKCCG